MINLTEKQKSDFKLLYKDKFGITLSDKEALVYSGKLINLMKPILIPNIED